ncbi:MAG: ribulose-phosphate 3-epimerase [Synergistales bacterium]|nr:ribulose-phosphate 3-epimerase [Synergistales bacterium]
MAGTVPVVSRMYERLSARRPLVAPSLLSADVLQLRQSVEELQGEMDLLHLDVMDGHYVPNLSFGPQFAAALREAYPETLLDVHLMVTPPEDFVPSFLEAKPDFLTVHCEAGFHIHRVLGRIAESGVCPGVAINPGTPVALLEPILHMVGMVLVLSVNPGFGGQSFLPETMEKVRSLVRWRETHGARYLIEVDGGLASENVSEVVAKGCDVVVAGNSIFGVSRPYDAVRSLRSAAEKGLRR